MKNQFVLMLAIIMVGSTVSSVEAVPVQWTAGEGHNHHYYEPIIVAEAISWSDAKAESEALMFNGMYGYLVTITSKEENEFVFDLINNESYWNGNNVGPWLGGFQPDGSPEPDGNWQWVTGEDFIYTHWRDGEPSDSLGIEDVVTFCDNPVGSYVRSSYWNDYPDDLGPISYVVEYTPEPATLLLLGLGGLVLRRKRKN
jgi:hypothetical protein